DRRRRRRRLRAVRGPDDVVEGADPLLQGVGDDDHLVADGQAEGVQFADQRPRVDAELERDLVEALRQRGRGSCGVGCGGTGRGEEGDGGNWGNWGTAE